MSSPRKYASPYLTGLPGLPSSSSSGAVKPKRKSKTSITKLSESAAAVKQIQDGIWQSAKDAGVTTTASGGDQASPRQETSFDDASACEGIVVEKILDEIEGAGASELTTADDAVEESSKATGAQGNHGAGEVMGASALIDSKDSVLLQQGSLKSSTEEENDHWGVPPEEDAEETPAIRDSSSPISLSPIAPAVLKSILKKPSIYTDKSKKEPSSSKKSNKSTVKGKYGRPVRESTRDHPGPPGQGRVINKLRGAQGSISNLEVHNKFNNNKVLAKSPRKTSKVGEKLGNEQEKEQRAPAAAVQVPKKLVRFSNRIDVHAVPYEPRAGSRACDWQRNMLEQRVQTFRQLMKEVGSAEDVDLFGNSMLFPGYPSYHVPNPNFALRGTNAGPPGLIGLPGIGRARHNFKL